MNLGFNRKLYFTGSVLFLIGSVLLTFDAMTQKDINYVYLSGMVAFDIGCSVFIIDSLLTSAKVIVESNAHSNEYKCDIQNLIVEVPVKQDC